MAAVTICSDFGARLRDFTFTFHFHALEKEMATHSSVLAWRIPGTEEPGGLPSMGSHRVGHDWSDLAAVAAAAVILEPPKIKSVIVSIVSSSIYHKVMEHDAMIINFWMLSFKPAFSLSFFTFMHWRRKWQLTLVFLSWESQGRGSLVGCHLWVSQGWTRLK